MVSQAAFAERVPVVAITGAPATAQFRSRALLHHTLGDYQDTVQDVRPRHGRVDPARGRCDGSGRDRPCPLRLPRAPAACLYLSPLRCCQYAVHCTPSICAAKPPPSDPATLKEAIAEGVAMLEAAPRPVVIGDVELIRFRLADEFAAFLERTGLPYATMMLGKTVLDESHPQFIGLYQGDRSRDYVRRRIETADCVLEFGALPTDFNTGGFTVQLPDERTITANIRSVKIKHHFYPEVALGDFILGLADRLARRDPALTGHQERERGASIGGRFPSSRTIPRL